VTTDDLNAPLGQHKKHKKLPKLPIGVPQLLAGVLGLFGLVVVGWAILVNDPLGGEPTAVVAAKAPGAAHDKPDSDGTQQSSVDSPVSAKTAPTVAAAGTAVAPPGSKIITIIDGSSGKSQNIIIPGNSSGVGARDAGRPEDTGDHAARRYPADRR